MVLFPEVQKKGQAELDAVLGGDQLPTWADRERLPYVDAILKELLRWGVVAPQALPHCALEESEYMGYTIEKGTMVVANSWYVNLSTRKTSSNYPTSVRVLLATPPSILILRTSAPSVS